MLSQYIQVKFSHIQSSILIPIFKKEEAREETHMEKVWSYHNLQFT